MNLKDAMKRSGEISNKMHEHANTASLASRTYTATMELFQVAAAAGDEAAMQAHRDTLHTTVDIILDEGAMLARLQRELDQLARTVQF